jgi:hypothetical protein
MGIMILILIVGALLIWRYVYHPPGPPHAIRTITPLPGAPHVAGGQQGGDSGLRRQVTELAAEADLPDGIHQRGPEDWLVKSGDAYLHVRRMDGQFKYAFGYFTLDEQEWEHGYLTQGVRRVLNEEDYARDLGVTSEQRAKLEQLPPAPKTTWPQADRDRLIALYKSDASRPQLVARLGDYAKARREAEHKLFSDRIEKIRAILTPAQLERINPIPRWPLNPASSPSAPDHAPHGP